MIHFKSVPNLSVYLQDFKYAQCSKQFGPFKYLPWRGRGVFYASGPGAHLTSFANGSWSLHLLKMCSLPSWSGNSDGLHSQCLHHGVTHYHKGYIFGKQKNKQMCCLHCTTKENPGLLKFHLHSSQAIGQWAKKKKLSSDLNLSKSVEHSWPQCTPVVSTVFPSKSLFCFSPVPVQILCSGSVTYLHSASNVDLGLAKQQFCLTSAHFCILRIQLYVCFITRG